MNTRILTILGALGLVFAFIQGCASSPTSMGVSPSMVGNENPLDPSPDPLDTTSPSVPSGLVATATSSSSIYLTWNASSDNVAVVGYLVYRGETTIPVITTTSRSASDENLTAGTSYTYKVAAYDAAGNISSKSAAVSATTQVASTGPYTLQITKFGTGSGTITGNGIICGATCTVSLARGTLVSLTATADESSTFIGWKNGCSGNGTCSFAMNGNNNIIAEFDDNNLPANLVWPTFSGGDHYIVNALSSDGSIKTLQGAVHGYYSGTDVTQWSDLISLETGYMHVVGLRRDGTVVAASALANDPAINVSSWTNIVAIAAGYSHTVGLKENGTVVVAGGGGFALDNPSLYAGWHDIVAVTAGLGTVIGVRSDGTPVTAGINNHGTNNVSTWTNLVAIASGFYQTIGLRSDGTVLVTGLINPPTVTFFRPLDITGWSNVIDISAMAMNAVGLRSDGGVHYTGRIDYNKPVANTWTNMISVGVSETMVMGVRSDGIPLMVGKYANSTTSPVVASWRLGVPASNTPRVPHGRSRLHPWPVGAL